MLDDPDIYWPELLDQHEAEITQAIEEDENFRHEAAHIARRGGEGFELKEGLAL